jgi:hypothetical protein
MPSKNFCPVFVDSHTCRLIEVPIYVAQIQVIIGVPTFIGLYLFMFFIFSVFYKIAKK